MTEITPALGLSAYFLGRRIAGQRRKPERVPVAYLYNYVRAPQLPERDGEVLPCAVLATYLRGTAVLYFLPEIGYTTFTSGTGVEKEGILIPPGSVSYNVEYDYANKTIAAWGEAVVQTEEEYFLFDSIAWTNTDIYCQTDFYGTPGEVYKAASNPIPVYA